MHPLNLNFKTVSHKSSVFVVVHFVLALKIILKCKIGCYLEFIEEKNFKMRLSLTVDMLKLIVFLL